jgi:hypothetical protein
VVLAANGNLSLFPMPAAKFCGGHTFFVQQSARRGECFNVHVTFTEGGIHARRAAARAHRVARRRRAGH